MKLTGHIRNTPNVVGPLSLAAVASHISAIADRNALQSSNTIVSICGGSCTGKSTQVALSLKNTLGNQAQILSQDHYMLASLGNVSDTVYRWDHPESFGLKESALVMDQLRNNIPCVMPQYSFLTRASEGMKVIRPSRVIIFEGLYAAYDFLYNHADFVVYVEMPLYARIIRRLIRNLFERYVNADARTILEGYLKAPLKAHQDFVVRQKRYADLILGVPFHFQEMIGKFHLRPLIDSGVKKECVYEFRNDEQTCIRISKDSHANYFFSLLYDSFVYIEFRIETATYEKFLTLDMHEV